MYNMRIKPSYIVLAISVISILLVNISCKKTTMLTSGGVLKFSVDTVKFDTVLTAAGSFTYSFVIYNIQNQEITLSSVTMQNGVSSYFHLNVDGYPCNPGSSVTNLKIAAHDSLYVFATVNIDSNKTNIPFYITDAMIATLNGKQFSVPFTAYGQNAHYIVGDSLFKPTIWDTIKPYVVIHTLVVGPGASLTIPANCKVYMHQDGEIVVYGQLNINYPTNPAAPSDSVVFQGDRLDRQYFGYTGYPGEWCGIWFLQNSKGYISHTTFKNCGGGTPYYNYFTQAAAMEVDSGAVVRIDHSIIQNSISLGLLSFQGYLIANSCLVNTTGGQALAITQGGIDTLTNCTFANYGTSLVSHANAGTVAILNYFTPDGTNYYFGDLTAVMHNCIVYGSLDSEIICDTSSRANASLLMDHCILKMGRIREPFITFIDSIFSDPMFKNPSAGDFTLRAGSPAINTGTATGAARGLTNLRDSSLGILPDIGCY
jgi:hypothetical protein